MIGTMNFSFTTSIKSTMVAAVIPGLLAAVPGWADSPKVVDVDAHKTGMSWRFSVTLRHGDTGWDHYADGWEVVDAAGNVLGRRDLLHPHVNEQPFTRSLNAVSVPDGVREVWIRSKCSVDGWSDPGFRVVLDPAGG